MTSARRAARPLVLAVAVVTVVGACTSAPEGDPVEVATTAEAAPPDPAAGDLRIQLERGFAVQAHLAAELVRVGGRRHAAAAATLDEAIASVADVVADAYDDDTGEQVADRLEAIAARLDRYRRVARRAGSRPAALAQARRQLRRSAADAAATMSQTTGGGLERPGTTALLRAALLDLADHIDAYVRGEFDDAYVTEREAYAAMTAVGRAFAAGISEHQPDQFPGPRRSGALELHSAVAQLIGEHSGLAATMMRRGSLGADDFDAAAAALAGNTDDLLAALDTIYPQAVGPFGAAWRDRISRLAEYTVAAAQAPRRRGDARGALRASSEDAAEALVAASEDTIDDELASALRQLDDALTAQIDAYVDGQPAQAEEHRLAALSAATDVAEVIAGGIAEHHPEDFPST